MKKEYEYLKNIDLQPKTCNLCGGLVIFTSNAMVYGKECGSGKMYFCTECKSYVGTHKDRPTIAMGILADKEMRDFKHECHETFDRRWKSAKTLDERKARRRILYKRLAEKMEIPLEYCHFGYFNMELLKKAYAVFTSSDFTTEKELAV